MGKKQASFSNFEQTPFEGKKAAIYVRVSCNEFLVSRKDEKKGSKLLTDTDIEEQVSESVKTQREDGIAYCRNPIRLWDYEIYDKDIDISGTLDSSHRPSLEQLLKDVRAGKIHTIIVRDIKRFARSSRILANIIHEDLLPAGVNFVGTDDNLSIATAQGRLWAQLLAAMAEYEVTEIKTKTMRTREHKAVRGALAHCPVTYGYQSTGRGQVDVVEAEAEVVRQIFHEYVEKNTPIRTIAEILTTQKAPNKTYRKKQKRIPSGIWHDSRIHKILRNPRYIGKINYRKHTMLESPFPPIISEDLWNKAQAELKRRGVVGPRTQNSINLLTGLLKCPFCIQRLQTDPTVKVNMFCMTANRSVKYYTCQAKHQRGKEACRGIAVNAGKIDSFIERFVGALAADEFLQFVSEKPDSKGIASRQVTIIKNQIEDNQQKRAALVKQVTRTGQSIDLILSLATELETSISNLTARLAIAEDELKQVSKAEQMDALDTMKKWKTLTMQQKRKALATVILQMVMYPDRLEITLRARPDSPLVIPYKSYRTRRKRPEFPDVTDGLLIGEYKDKLVIRVGAEFATIDGRKIRMHIDPVGIKRAVEDSEIVKQGWH